MKSYHALSQITALICIALIAFACLLHAAGARFNLTPSIPVGLYWVTQKPIQKGEYVLFCPPQTFTFKEALSRGYINSGFCPGGLGYMMKKVFAITGDRIAITSSGVWVNGVQVPLSAPLVQDSHGRGLPRLNEASHTLKSDQLLLMTDQSAKSFDARYFGLINQSQVVSVIRPVITWKFNDHFNEQGTQ